jgi:hypothetical protein
MERMRRGEPQKTFRGFDTVEGDRYIHPFPNR